MLHKLFHLFVRRTHFWRTVSVSEMAELYSSRMLRVIAMNMIGGFGAVYFYQLGYSLQWLAWYFVAMFSFRLLFAPFVAITIARYGPKHSILISNIIFIFAALLLALAPVMGVLALILLIPIGGFGRFLYDAAYLVDFSKVKHVDHAGKEIGIMQIIERVMTALAPIVGGLVAFFISPVAMMVVAALVMLVSALPLFFTSEPVKTHQKLTLRHFNLKTTWRSMLAHVAVGIDTNASGMMWNLFIVIVIFGVVNNSSYIQIGILSSIALFASIIISYLYGKIVDRSGGKRLLKLSVIGDVLVYLLRPFAVNPLQVAAINVSNEIVTTGYTIPAVKGVFSTADGLPGYRIVFITIMVAMLTLGDVIVPLILAVLLTFSSDQEALKNLFIVVAPLLLLISLHSSAIYRHGLLTRFIHRV